MSSKQKKVLIVSSVVSVGMLLFVYWLIPPVWRLSGGSVLVTQWLRNGGEQQVEIGPAKPGWIGQSAVSRHVLHAIVVSEDARFFMHHGLDLEEIKASLDTNLKNKRYVRGASTITQQVVKMAFLSRDKSLVRKFREAIGSLLVEKLLTKNQILTWYINLAEFGDGVYGIKAASYHYFKTKPELLTISQAVHLALVLPSPNLWSKGLKLRELTDFGHQRFSVIANRMKLVGYITDEQWLNTLATGDFGRPLKGYEKVLASHDEAEKQMQGDEGFQQLVDEGAKFSEKEEPSEAKETAVAPKIEAEPAPTVADATLLPTDTPALEPTLEPTLESSPSEVPANDGP